MFFWLLTVIVLASLAGIGYRQGAIRVAFSLLGIIVGALLAAPLGKLLTPLVGVFGIKNPVAAGALGPLIVFVVISVLFKVGAFYAHQKIEVHFKYRAGDLRLALWERMNHRVGLCLALVNGTLYLVLISFVLFVFGYWTVQLSSDDKDPKLMRLVTRLAHDLQSTGSLYRERNTRTCFLYFLVSSQPNHGRIPQNSFDLVVKIFSLSAAGIFFHGISVAMPSFLQNFRRSRLSCAAAGPDQH